MSPLSSRSCAQKLATIDCSGFKCTELFGTLKQEEREQRLLSFKAGEILLYHFRWNVNFMPFLTCRLYQRQISNITC